MVYETFLKTIHAMVQERLQGRARVSLQQVLKNNGLLLDGLTIAPAESCMAPTVYLNAYYEEAEKGLPLSIITDQIVLLYESDPGIPEETAREVQQFESVRDKIAYKLIHAGENKTLLATIPHIRYLDLAIIFYFIVAENEDGQMTALIRREHLKLWGITEEDVIQLAEKNTPRLLPAKITPIEQALANLDTFSLLPQEDLPPVHLKVLTNNREINGAACILYPNLLKNLADDAEDDLIIIPSSIHEVLVSPQRHALPYQELNAMIRHINQTDVPPEDRLADHVYCYSRSQSCLYLPSLPFHRPYSSASGETENPQ